VRLLPLLYFLFTCSGLLWSAELRASGLPAEPLPNIGRQRYFTRCGRGLSSTFSIALLDGAGGFGQGSMPIPYRQSVVLFFFCFSGLLVPALSSGVWRRISFLGDSLFRVSTPDRCYQKRPSFPPFSLCTPCCVEFFSYFLFFATPTLSSSFFPPRPSEHIVAARRC